MKNGFTHLNFSKKNFGGFTLIELLVVAVIISILTGFILANYPSIGREFALQRSANKLAQDIRKVQGNAVAMKEISGSLPEGYGVYLNKVSFQYSYKLFADEDGNYRWESATDTLVEMVSFESNVKINDLKIDGISTDTLSIVFEPPDPTIWINNFSSSSSTITLQLETDPNKTKTISVNSSGLITTE